MKTNSKPTKIYEVLTNLPPYAEDNLTTDEIMSLWNELQNALTDISALIKGCVPEKRENTTTHEELLMNGGYNKAIAEILNNLRKIGIE